MPVTYVTDAEDTDVNVTSTTVPVTPSGTNRYMAVVIAAWDASTTDSAIASVTFNGSGVGWSSLKDELGPGANVNRAALWGKVAPDAVAANVVVTYGGTVSESGVHVIVADTVNQSTPVGTAFSGEGTASPITVTVTGVGNDDLVIDGGYIHGVPSSVTAGADQTERANLLITAANSRIFASTQPGTAGGVMSWTGTMDEWVQVAVALKGNPGHGRIPELAALGWNL